MAAHGIAALHGLRRHTPAMAGSRHARDHRLDPAWDSTATPGARIKRIETAAPSHRAVLDGLDPGRLDPVARASALRGIGSAAGNAAVASLVGRVTANMPQDPPGGVREIRRVGGGGTLGHTRALMEDAPPLFRLPSPAAADGSYSVRPGRTRAPELDFEVRYPAPGRHVMYEARSATGGQANTYLEISSDWSATIRRG